MSEELEYDAFAKSMETKYPKMFSKPYGGFAVGRGWWPILQALCNNIQHYIDWNNKNRELRPIVEQVVVTQIKEKLGGLRFYYDGGDEGVAGMVRMAESWAAHSCEECGKPGIHRHGGWLKTLCDEHEAARQERIKERLGEDYKLPDKNSF